MIFAPVLPLVESHLLGPFNPILHKQVVIAHHFFSRFTLWVIHSGATKQMSGLTSVFTSHYSQNPLGFVHFQLRGNELLLQTFIVFEYGSYMFQTFLQIFIRIANFTMSLNSMMTFYPSHCVFRTLQWGGSLGMPIKIEGSRLYL